MMRVYIYTQAKYKDERDWMGIDRMGGHIVREYRGDYDERADD